MTRGRLVASLVVGLLLARGAPAFAQDESTTTTTTTTPAVAAAQQRFERAQQRYIARDFAAALAESRASLALYDSPNTRLYVARSLRELGRLDEAVVEFERTARQARALAAEVSAERYAGTRDAAEQELAALEHRVGRLAIQLANTPPAVRVEVGGRALPLAALGESRPVMPGEIAVAVRAPGYTSFRSLVAVQPGREQVVFVSLAPLPPAPPPANAGALTLLVSGLVLSAAGFGATGGFWYLANQEYASVNMLCVPRPCTTQVGLDAISRGETYQTLANTGVVVGTVGAVMAAAGMVWLLASNRRGEGAAPARRTADARGVRGALGVAPSATGFALAWGGAW